MTAAKPPPEVLSLIVCDQIIVDRMTGKHSLIGLFSRIHAHRFPLVHAQLCVFTSLTEGYGRVDLTIRIADGDDARSPVVEGKGKVDFRDPRAVAQMVLQFNGLTFPQPGQYRLQIFSDGELLREARLDLVKVTPREPPPRKAAEGSN